MTEQQAVELIGAVKVCAACLIVLVVAEAWWWLFERDKP